MFVAKQKRKDNIGEYLLYMFQIEDLIRACSFNPSLIEKNLISQYTHEDLILNDIRNWYLGLSELMVEEKIQETGHLSFVKHIMSEVYDFHLFLLQNSEYTSYQKKYMKNESLLQSLKTGSIFNEIELMVSFIYSVFIAKLRNQTIPNQVQESALQISTLLAQLSLKFAEYEKGLLKIE